MFDTDEITNNNNNNNNNAKTTVSQWFLMIKNYLIPEIEIIFWLQ